MSNTTTNTILSHYWFLTVTNATNTTLNQTFATETYTQNLLTQTLTECTGLTDGKLLNISFWDEEEIDERLISGLSGYIISFNHFGTPISNISFYHNNTDHVLFCGSSNLNITVDAVFFNEVSGGFIQRWYLNDVNLTNSSLTTIKIYNHGSTTGISDFLGTVRNTEYTLLPNIISVLERYYPANNTWIGVQMDKADNFGHVFFNVIEETVDYQIVFYDDTSLVYRSEPIKFICTSGVCNLEFRVDTSATSRTSNLVLSWNYNNNTKYGTLTFTDTSGVTSNVRLNVNKVSYGSVTNVCNKNLSASSGTIGCNLTGYSGTFIVNVYSSASPELWQIMITISDAVNLLYNQIPSNDRAFWALGFGLTSIGLGLISPVLVIIMSLVGLILIVILQITEWATLAWLISLLCIGLILAVRISKVGK